MNEDFKKKEKSYIKINEENSKLINDKEFIIQELEQKLDSLNEEYLITKKAKLDLENIILKQEEKVNELGNKVNRIENILKKKNAEIKQNEDYAIKLMNIVKEQKSQMENIRNLKNENDNDILLNLQNEIENLKNTIELRDHTITKLQKNHKSLQEKHLKVCSDKRKKEPDELLNQAKDMKVKKIERERGNSSNKSIYNNNTKSEINIRNDNIKSEINMRNDNTKNEINIRNDNINNNNKQKIIKLKKKEDNKDVIPKIDIRQKPVYFDNNIIDNIDNNSNILPLIGNSNLNENINNDKLKDEKNDDLSNLKLNISQDDEKYNEINDMMKKIIDEF